MAELKVINLKKVETSIRKKIIKQLRDKSIRDGIGKLVVEEIQATKFGTAKKKTQSWRKWLEKANKTHETYFRSKINITFTGRLLEDLSKNVKARFNKGEASFVIEHSNKKHPRYKRPPKPKGSKRKRKPLKDQKQLTHAEISEEIIKKGYDYLTFNDRINKRVLKFIKDRVFKKLK